MSKQTTIRVIGDLRIDFDGYRLWKQGQPIELTRHEWKLFRVLVRNQGRMVEGEVLVLLVWGEMCRGELRRLYEYIHRLRRKLGDNPKAPRYLWSSRYLGYRFEVVPAASALAERKIGGAQ